MDTSREWHREQEFDALKREMTDLQKRVARLERELEWAMRGPKSDTVSYFPPSNHLPGGIMWVDEDGA